MAKGKDEHEQRIGQQIAGKYRIERLLGAGGMGAVYVAQHEFTNRRVALKLMHASFSRSKVAAERFLREARAPSAIGHPGIVEVLDGGREDDGSLYLVLELLEGQTLAQAIHDEQLSPQRVVELGLELLAALQAAHDAGFVHRDLKPENIFLPEQGETQIKLLDFGVAGLLVPETNPHLTAVGAVLGTPLYMSPEQALGRRIDARSDLWSLGAVLYQALSGELPFGGDTVPALIVSISTQPHLPLSVLRPELPRRVAAVIDRALQKGPDQRWPSAEAMAEALQNAAEPIRRPVTVERVPAEAPPQPSAEPRGIPGALVVGAVLIAVLGGLGMVVLQRRAHAPNAERAAPSAAAASIARADRPPEPAAPEPKSNPPVTAGARAPSPAAAEAPSERAVAEGRAPAQPPATPGPAAAPARPPLSAEQLQEVVSHNQAELQRCYEQSVLDELLKAGAAQPDPKPVALTVKLAIAADGKVRKVALEGTPRPELATCLTAALERFRFPEGPSETQAGFPIVFQPQVVRR